MLLNIGLLICLLQFYFSIECVTRPLIILYKPYESALNENKFLFCELALNSVAKGEF
jgi:hypothetical protein